jgi:hypothetical protein
VSKGEERFMEVAREIMAQDAELLRRLALGVSDAELLERAKTVHAASKSEDNVTHSDEGLEALRDTGQRITDEIDAVPSP